MESKTMKAAIVEDAGKVVIKDVPIPVPKSGQVLIRVESAPINPSDYYTTLGQYEAEGVSPSFPHGAGFEGSGTVVENGGGLMGWKLKGKRVAFAAPIGSWAQYVVTDSIACLEIDSEIDFNHGACSFVNPFTVTAFLNIAKETKSETVVQDAAASALGKMLIRLFKEEGIKTINIVRKEEQIKELEKLGATVVLNQEDKEFEEKLKKATKEHNALIFFDAVSGDLPGKVLKNMPKGSTCYNYGCLSLEKLSVECGELLTNDKIVRGFHLGKYMPRQSLVTQGLMVRKVSKYLKTIFASNIYKEYPLSQVNEAIADYNSNMSRGKVIIKPQLE